MKKPMLTAVLSFLLALSMSAFALPRSSQSDTTQSDSGMKQDIKDAGHSTKNATKKGARKVKKGTKKGIHAGAKKTKEGANKVEDKTDNH